MPETGYNLNPGHKVRYFFGKKKLHKLLKQMAQFVEDNPQVEVVGVHVDTRLDYENNATLRHEGFIVYLGSAN